LTRAIQWNPDQDQHIREKAAEERLLSEVRDTAARIHVPGLTVGTFNATSTLVQRQRPILQPRSVYGHRQDFVPAGPHPPPRFSNDFPVGFARPAPRPPAQLQSYSPSHPPPPHQPGYPGRPKLPRVEWIEEDPDSRILATLPGTAAYYKKSLKFRRIKVRGVEQIPGEMKSETDNKRRLEEDPEELVMIYGMRNARRATSNRQVDARTQLHNKRA
jgi:hypothetical protein